MSHGINHNNGHIRSRETYTSAITDEKRDNLMEMMQDCLIIITTDLDLHTIIR